MRTRHHQRCPWLTTTGLGLLLASLSFSAVAGERNRRAGLTRNPAGIDAVAVSLSSDIRSPHHARLSADRQSAPLVDPGTWRELPSRRGGPARLTAGSNVLAPQLTLGGPVRMDLELPGFGGLALLPVGLRSQTKEGLTAWLPEGSAERVSDDSLNPTGLRVRSSWLGVDEDFRLRAEGVEHDLVLHPAAVDALVGGDLRASWVLRPPEGTAFGLEPGAGAVLRDEKGRFVARIPAPVVGDANMGGHLIAGIAHLELTPMGTVSLLTVVTPGAWLSSPERAFPIRIDPSVTRLEVGGDSFVGRVDEDGNKTLDSPVSSLLVSGSILLASGGADNRTFAEFDTSSIPDNADILSVELEVWLSNHDNSPSTRPTNDDPPLPLEMEVHRNFSRAGDPGPVIFDAIGPWDGGVLYAERVIDPTGDRWDVDSYMQVNLPLDALAEGDLEDRLVDDWFSIGLVNEIKFDTDFDHLDYVGFHEHRQGEPLPAGSRIELLIEFNVPPVCDAGGPYLRDCPDEPIELDGRASSDFDGDALTYAWTTSCMGTLSDADQAVATLQLDPGCGEVCSVGLTVSDGLATSRCLTSVDARDRTAPVILCGAPAEAFWPPLVTCIESLTLAELLDPSSSTEFSHYQFSGPDSNFTVGASDGTFHVSCSSCLEVGDENGGLVVVDIVHDGGLDLACAATPGGPRSARSARSARSSSSAGPVIFTATAEDDCGEVVLLTALDPLCYLVEEDGTRTPLPPEECPVSVRDASVFIVEPPEPPSVVEWTVEAEDACGNRSQETCSTLFLRPPADASSPSS